MKCRRNEILIGILVLLMAGSSTFAAPSREEVYRSDKLRTVVYRDGRKSDIFWYVPPIKLVQENGKVKYFKRTKGLKTEYHFYLQAYMTDDLLSFFAGELGLVKASQFKPVIAKKFGIQLKQFAAVSMSDEITDYQYLNNPHLVKISLNSEDAKEFEFFLGTTPGIQANVLIEFVAEKEEKYLTIELSHKEIYDAMSVGIAGKAPLQAVYVRGEIEAAVADYLSTKNLDIRGKGDLQIPNIVNKVITECFKQTAVPAGQEEKPCDFWNPNCQEDDDGDSNTEMNNDVNNEGSTLLSSGGRNSKGIAVKGAAGVGFKFRKELANSNKTFKYSDVRTGDATEVTEIPTYLSTQATRNVVAEELKITTLPKKNFVVTGKNSMQSPLATGIQVEEGTQLTVTMSYTADVQSRGKEKKLNPTLQDKLMAQSLYYRVGNGPWTRALSENGITDGRLLIQEELIEKGELLFYLDKAEVWNRLDPKLRKPQLWGAAPSMVTLNNFNPQFSITVTGRKYNFPN